MRRVTAIAFGSVLAASLLVAVAAVAQNWHRLPGEIGASSRWGSGWLDLAPPADFKKGEKLRLTLGGSAAKVLVRLLARGDSPDDPSGVLGEYTVPPSKVVEVALKDEYKTIVQVSVHGGPNPWGKYPLGPGNGPATLRTVERASP
jgi:hypothetical protein